MNIELMGYIEVNTISNTETLNSNEECWSMQFCSRQQIIDSVSEKCNNV